MWSCRKLTQGTKKAKSTDRNRNFQKIVRQTTCASLQVCPKGYVWLNQQLVWQPVSQHFSYTYADPQLLIDQCLIGCLLQAEHPTVYNESSKPRKAQWRRPEVWNSAQCNSAAFVVGISRTPRVQYFPFPSRLHVQLKLKTIGNRNGLCVEKFEWKISQKKIFTICRERIIQKFKNLRMNKVQFSTDTLGRAVAIPKIRATGFLTWSFTTSYIRSFDKTFH